MELDLTGFWRELTQCERDVPRLLDLIAEHVAVTIGEGAVPTVLEDDGRTLRPVAFHHRDAEVRKEMSETLTRSPYRLGEGVAGGVAASRQPVVLSDAEPEDLEPELWRPGRAFADRHPIRSMMIVPSWPSASCWARWG